MLEQRISGQAMLNQRSASEALVDPVQRDLVPGDTQLPDVIVRWAQGLRDRGLGDVGLLLTDLLKVWGFAGSQLLWMVAPLLTGTAVDSVARVLENPAMLDQVQVHLGADRSSGTAKERVDD